MNTETGQPSNVLHMRSACIPIVTQANEKSIALKFCLNTIFTIIDLKSDEDRNHTARNNHEMI